MIRAPLIRKRHPVLAIHHDFLSVRLDRRSIGFAVPVRGVVGEADIARIIPAIDAPDDKPNRICSGDHSRDSHGPISDCRRDSLPDRDARSPDRANGWHGNEDPEEHNECANGKATNEEQDRKYRQRLGLLLIHVPNVLGRHLLQVEHEIVLARFHGENQFAGIQV